MKANNTPVTVLVIDDEQAIRESIAASLEDLDYAVLTADNGRAGLDLFVQQRPDIVLTDLRMPEVDGLEVLREVKELSPNTPAIVVSGTGRIGDSIEAMRLGAWDYILKPINDMSLLAIAVSRALEHARLVRENNTYQLNLEKLVHERTAELKKANEHLRASRERFRDLVEMLPEAIFEMNKDMVLTFGNQRAFDLFQYDRDDLERGVRGLDLIEPGDRERAEQAFRSRVNGEDIGATEYYGLRKDGSVFPVLIHMNRIEKDGELQGFRGILVDHTEQKQVEEQIIRARDAAEAANRAKNVFLANMSHELRTPLNPIIGFTEFILEDPELKADHRKCLEIVRDRGSDLLRLLSDILNIAQIEANKMILRPAAVRIGLLVRDVASMFEQMAAEKSLELSVQAGSELDDLWVVDPARLRQILLNLVGNAVKFTDTGRVEVAASLESGKPGMLNVTVRDTGCGIPPDIQEVIFDSFQQADNSSTREYGGAGLGLAICKRLSVLMKGDIQLKSQPGEGSAFTVRLPVSAVGPERSPATSPENAPAAIKKARSCRILLVEDDPVSMELACRVLSRGGHTLTCVANGKTALDSCRNETFDLVLMDLKLPVMDGLEATRRLRQSGFSAPIIALTACAFDEDRQACLDAGMDAWMTKPVTPEALEQAIAGIAPREDDTRTL